VNISISVILCTHNRCTSLKRTLESFEKAEPPDSGWELLVVDNASTDQTRDTCLSFSDRLPLRYMLEPRVGKSRALNLGIMEAAGNLLLFTDDDVEVDRGWLMAYKAAATNFPDVDFFGGCIRSRWEAPPPKWVLENQKQWLGIITQLDYGQQEIEYQPRKRPYFGANMAIRSHIFSGGTRFLEQLGPQGRDSSRGGNIRGEETELQERLHREGKRGLYIPKASVHHWEPARRMTEAYLRRYKIGNGISDVRMGNIEMTRLCFGVPSHWWRVLFVGAVTYAFSRLGGPSWMWVEAEANFSHAWGVITECRRLARENRDRQLPENGHD
jgi:glucosyl-dolichyl phosphate glucuronosyltransferase